MLKGLLFVASASDDEALYEGRALQETLFGLAFTPDAEVRLLAMHVLHALGTARGASSFLATQDALDAACALVKASLALARAPRAARTFAPPPQRRRPHSRVHHVAPANRKPMTIALALVEELVADVRKDR